MRNKSSLAMLVLVGAVHYGYHPLTGWLGLSAAAWFYVLRGLEGVVLYAALWGLAPKSAVIRIGCLWGIVESAQTSICRLAAGAGFTSPAAYRGVCDSVSGVSISAVVALVVLVAIAIAQECEQK